MERTSMRNPYKIGSGGLVGKRFLQNAKKVTTFDAGWQRVVPGSMFWSHLGATWSFWVSFWVPFFCGAGTQEGPIFSFCHKILKNYLTTHPTTMPNKHEF